MGRYSTALQQLLVAVAVSSIAQAAKDDTYYPNGIVNPNVKRSMYWNGASNVLQDLSQFSELYVQFHSCAWSPLSSENGEHRQNNVDENDYWYMNAMPSFGPNVAFSLYGALEGDNFSGCGRKSYINSFYTTAGFPVFANALTSAGIDNTGTQYSTSCENNMGVTCSDNSGSSTFAMMSYNGQCTPEYAQKASIPSNLASFNTVLKNDAHCVKIYSSGDSAPSLLQYSHACSLVDSVGVCPDPWGKKSAYERELTKVASPSSAHRQEMMKGSLFLVVGAVLLIAAAMLIRNATKSYPVPKGYGEPRRRRKSRRATSPRAKEKSRREKKSKSTRDKSARSSKRHEEDYDAMNDKEELRAQRESQYVSPSDHHEEPEQDDAYLAPLETHPAEESYPEVSNKLDSDGQGAAMDPPSSTPVPLTRSPSFASARSNIEVQVQPIVVEDGDYDDDDADYFDNEWGSKPKVYQPKYSSRRSIHAPPDWEERPSQETVTNAIVSGLSSLYGAKNSRHAHSTAESTAHSADAMILSPSFLTETTDGDDSGLESSKSRIRKMRQFMAMKRKTQR